MKVGLKILLCLVIITISAGCQSSKSQPSAVVEAPTPIKTSNDQPQELLWLPPYPETPAKTTYQEYENGWQITYQVLNPLAIARDATLDAWLNNGWQQEDEIATETNEWTVLKKDKKISTLRLQSINDDETLITTYVSK